MGGSANDTTMAWLGELELAPVVSPGEPVGSDWGNVNTWVRLLARLVPAPPWSIVARLAMADAGGSCPSVTRQNRGRRGRVKYLSVMYARLRMCSSHAVA